MIGLVIPNILAFYELKLHDDYCKNLGINYTHPLIQLLVLEARFNVLDFYPIYK